MSEKNNSISIRAFLKQLLLKAINIFYFYRKPPLCEVLPQWVRPASGSQYYLIRLFIEYFFLNFHIISPPELLIIKSKNPYGLLKKMPWARTRDHPLGFSELSMCWWVGVYCIYCILSEVLRRLSNELF